MANRKRVKFPSDSTGLASPGSKSAIPRDDRPSDEEIRMRAYELYLERGAENGNDVEDWLRAEREYRQESQKTQRDSR